jgi:predicted nucleic acid-binding protein
MQTHWRYKNSGEMIGSNLLVDSNIVVYFLFGYKNVQKFFISSRPALSFISELEVLSSANFTDNDFDNAKNLLTKHEIIGYLPELRDIIIDIRSQKKLKLPDAIIAATAIYLNVPLVSADKGFKNIEGLDLILHDPASL